MGRLRPRQRTTARHMSGAVIPSVPRGASLPREALFEKATRLGRVSLAAGGLHELADEEAHQRGLAPTVRGDLLGVTGDHLVDEWAEVGSGDR